MRAIRRARRRASSLSRAPRSNLENVDPPTPCSWWSDGGDRARVHPDACARRGDVLVPPRRKIRRAHDSAREFAKGTKIGQRYRQPAVRYPADLRRVLLSFLFSLPFPLLYRSRNRDKCVVCSPRRGRDSARPPTVPEPRTPRSGSSSRDNASSARSFSPLLPVRFLATMTTARGRSP